MTMTSAKVTRGRSQRSRLTTAIGVRPARDRESHRGVDMKGALVFEGGRPAKGKEGMRGFAPATSSAAIPPSASVFL